MAQVNEALLVRVPGHQVARDASLDIGWGSREYQAERGLSLLPGLGSRTHALGNSGRLRSHELIVEHGQGLQDHGRGLAAGAVRGEYGLIEGVQQGRMVVAAGEQVKASP